MDCGLFRRPGVLICAVAAGLIIIPPVHSAERFELSDNDRVVLLGATFVEREGQFGYIETVLTTAWPERKLTFRNLGWSGDTVWAESRGMFDSAPVGYQRMLELVKELKPTVVVFGYGQNESYSGEFQGRPIASTRYQCLPAVKGCGRSAGGSAGRAGIAGGRGQDRLEGTTAKGRGLSDRM